MPTERHKRGRALELFRPLPMLVLLALFALGAFGRSSKSPGTVATDGADAVAHALAIAPFSLETTHRDVHWLDEPRGTLASLWDRPRAVVRARASGGDWDVYLVRTRLSPEGKLMSVTDVFNLTRTSAVSEEALDVRDGRAVWSIGNRDRTLRVELADVRGEPAPRRDGEEWTLLSRIQRALTNLQHTGQLAGVGRRSFKLDPAATHVSFVFEPERLVIVADDHRIAIPFAAGLPIEGERFIREEDRSIARPGNLVTWAVDRARDLSWLGDERMQITKAIAYAALDRVDRAMGAVRSPEVEAPTAPELGSDGSAARTDPETGWPPEALAPLDKPPAADEGKWFLLDAHDPYVRTSAAVPVPLVTTFLRADPARPESRVFIVEWDPRQVDLDVVAGTEEPQSATGETGDGMIPRTPETMTRVVAAFNGGFQSTHGDFGMMRDGTVIVPPRPYAATVARLEDGSTGFGTWPLDLSIPKDVVSFRQNLTPLVGDGKFNPYGREWWGGVPHDWEDITHTVRSGLCLTKDGFVAYFYGTSIDHVHLGRVMIAARCDYGMHLDMNQGHTGLELYRADEAKNLPPLSGGSGGAKLDGVWQAEDDVIDMPGFRFRGRRLFRNMQLMHFPRYIRRGARDYFYLKLRPLLPGEPLTGLAHDAGEGQWTVRGLPQHGFPLAIATTTVRPDPARPETKVRVLALDPAMLRVAASDVSPTETVVAIDEVGRGHDAGASLWLGEGRAWIAEAQPAPSAMKLAAGSSPPGGGGGGRVVAGAGVDADGKIIYAEVATAPDPARDASLLSAVFDAAHCTARLFFSAPLGVAIAGAEDLAGHPVRGASRRLRLVRAQVSAPGGGEVRGARKLFSETPVLRPSEWMPLQRQTRWFPRDTAAAPGAPAAPDGKEAPTPGGSATPSGSTVPQ